MSCPPILSVPEIETEAAVDCDSAGFRTVNEKVKSVEMGRVPAVVRTRLPPACDQAPEAALPEPEPITCARQKWNFWYKRQVLPVRKTCGTRWFVLVYKLRHMCVCVCVWVCVCE